MQTVSRDARGQKKLKRFFCLDAHDTENAPITDADKYVIIFDCLLLLYQKS